MLEFAIKTSNVLVPFFTLLLAASTVTELILTEEGIVAVKVNDFWPSLARNCTPFSTLAYASKL